MNRWTYPQYAEGYDGKTGTHKKLWALGEVIAKFQKIKSTHRSWYVLLPCQF